MKLKHQIKSKALRYYKKIEIKDHKLLYLFLEITRKCNLNCLHCGSDCKADYQTAELTTKSWLKIIDYFSEHYSDKLVFVITGGEPLIHPDLLRIAKQIQLNNRRWGMVTNAMALSKKKFDALTEAGLYSITVSIDGLKDSHNKLRNHPQAFNKVLDALELIGTSKLKFKDAVTCVYPDNINELDEIAEILISKGITSWRLFRIFPSGRAFQNTDTELSFKQTQKMLDWIKDNKRMYEEKGLRINLSCEGWLPINIDEQVRDDAFFCRSGINMASILVDGNITGCSNNHESFRAGNILNDDFSYVWENKFEDMRERKWLKNTVCNACEHIKDCNGGSIHLWNLGEFKPKFCYVKEL